MKWYFAQQTLFYCWTFRFETAVGKCKERFSSVFFFLVCTQPHQPPPRENQMFWCRSRSCPWSLCVHLKMEKRQSEGREGSDYFWITRANDLEWATRQKVGFGCSFHWQMLPFVKSGLDSQDSQLCNQSTLIHKWDSMRCRGLTVLVHCCPQYQEYLCRIVVEWDNTFLKGFSSRKKKKTCVSL